MPRQATITFDCDAEQFIGILCNFADCVDPEDWSGNSFCITVDHNDVNDVIASYSSYVDGVDSVESSGSSYNESWDQCANDGDWYPCSELRETPNGEMINESDWNELYYDCDDCGCCVDRDNLMVNHDGEGYCEDCYCSNGGGVQEFDGCSKTFDSANSFGSSRSFGIELETNAGRCSEDYAFDGKSDGSIDGTEFVSHILRGDAGLAELKDFMASGDGIEIGENCGCHIHINMKDLARHELYAVYAAYAVAQDDFADMTEDRMGGGYSACLDYEAFTRITENYANGIDFADCARRTSRYYWINVSAYNGHGTFENRLHQGSWDYAELSAWIIFNLRFVRAARYLTIAPNETAESYYAKVKHCLDFARSTENDLRTFYDGVNGPLTLLAVA